MPETALDVDVAVVGAGPTGLAIACALGACGVGVRVIDQAPGPAESSRAFGLQPRGVEILDRLNALDGLPAEATDVRQLRIHVNGRHTASLRVGQRTPLVRRPGLLISQARIEAALRDRLAELGVSVEWGRELVDAEQDPTGVTVRPAHDSPFRAGWLVGCDGAHSQVRKLAAIDFSGTAIIEQFALADVHAEVPLPRDTMFFWLHGGRTLGMFPLPGVDRWRLAATWPSNAGSTRTDREESPSEAVARMFEEQTGWSAALIDRTDWESTFRIHRRLAANYRAGRILLAGDAAHIHSPLGGQGLNTGISDAENLAWKLALVVTGRAESDLLDSYQGERRPVATDVLATTSRFTELVLSDNVVARFVRDRLLVPLVNRPGIQRRLWERLSQLRVSYRDGPLAVGGSWPRTRGVRPGDRVPDVACRRGDGEATRLHAELCPRWAVLVADPARVGEFAATAGSRLGTDTVCALVPTEEVVDDALLVRPDAHLGWRGSSPDGLERWLADVLEYGHVR